MNIYLVRHGETEWNKIGRIQGNLDVPLNESGKEQARGMISLISNINFQFIYTSGLLRAIETAEILLPQHNGKVKYSELNERNFGDWQGRLWSEVHSENPNLQQEWQQQGGNYRPPNGESLTEMISRSYFCFERIVRNHKVGDSMIIIGHGGPIKGILGRLEGLEDGLIPSHYSIGNCSVTKVNYNGKFSIDFVNHMV